MSNRLLPIAMSNREEGLIVPIIPITGFLIAIWIQLYAFTPNRSEGSCSLSADTLILVYFTDPVRCHQIVHRIMNKIMHT